MKKSLDYLALILLCSENTATGLFVCFFSCVIGGLTVPLFRENIPGLRLPGTGIYNFNSFAFPSFKPKNVFPTIILQPIQIITRRKTPMPCAMFFPDRFNVLRIPEAH